MSLVMTGNSATTTTAAAAAFDASAAGTISAAADSDAALVRRAAAGDVDAFGLLVERYQRPMAGLVGRMADSPDDVDDIVQELFIRAWKGLPRFRGDAQFSTWLYRIATNCWLADARKRKEELLGDRADTIADEDDEAMPHIGDEAHADHARGASLKMDLERAMAALSEGERAAIVQCYHNDLTHEEAAYVLGCPVGTVKTHVLRGKQKLKAALAAYGP